jgi:hypothetical protein
MLGLNDKGSKHLDAQPHRNVQHHHRIMAHAAGNQTGYNGKKSVALWMGGVEALQLQRVFVRRYWLSRQQVCAGRYL